MDQLENLRRNVSVLKKAGFSAIEKREIWICLDRRMVFGRKTLRERDLEWLEGKVNEALPEGEFRFHFYPPVDPNVCHEILEELGLSHLVPVPGAD